VAGPKRCVAVLSLSVPLERTRALRRVRAAQRSMSVLSAALTLVRARLVQEKKTPEELDALMAKMRVKNDEIRGKMEVRRGPSRSSSSLSVLPLPLARSKTDSLLSSPLPLRPSLALSSSPPSRPQAATQDRARFEAERDARRSAEADELARMERERVQRLSEADKEERAKKARTAEVRRLGPPYSRPTGAAIAATCSPGAREHATDAPRYDSFALLARSCSARSTRSAPARPRASSPSRPAARGTRASFPRPPRRPTARPLHPHPRQRRPTPRSRLRRAPPSASAPSGRAGLSAP